MNSFFIMGERGCLHDCWSVITIMLSILVMFHPPTHSLLNNLRVLSPPTFSNLRIPLQLRCVNYREPCLAIRHTCAKKQPFTCSGCHMEGFQAKKMGGFMVPPSLPQYRAFAANVRSARPTDSKHWIGCFVHARVGACVWAITSDSESKFNVPRLINVGAPTSVRKKWRPVKSSRGGARDTRSLRKLTENREGCIHHRRRFQAVVFHFRSRFLNPHE